MASKNPIISAKSCEHMTFAGKEAFKRLRANVMIALDVEKEKRCRVIGVTSGQPSEGKSTVSINLSYTLAEMGKSVLLIDGDMRRPSIHVNMGVSSTPGLSEVLLGSAALKEVIERYRSSVDETSFDMILGGECPENPSELLSSGRFQKLIEAASSVYDFVIVDLPPINVVIDAVSVSKCTDGLIFVLRENHCPRGILMSAVEQLRYAKANILGFVINGSVGGAGKAYQYSQKYSY